MAESVMVKSVPLVRSESDKAQDVDHLIQKTCEQNGVPPVYRYLTALYDLDRRGYLGAHETIGGDGTIHELQLRLRFHPFRSELLEEPNTLNIYYHQMLYYLFNEFKVKEYSHELVSQLVGFVAMDYVRQLIERNETPTDEKTIELLESSTLPATWRFLWWKKKVVKKDFIQCVNQCFTDCDLDLSTLKTAFIDGVCELLPGSRQEQYEAQVLRNGVTYDVRVIVGHLSFGTSEAREGPYLKIFNDNRPGDTFPMSQMAYLLRLDANTVEIHLRDELPILMLLGEQNLIEFCTLIDGYYRMTERFTACLCSDIQPPSIVAMKKRKIHGPIRGSIARKKLAESGITKGCYLVRRDQLSYRIFHVDTLFGDGRLDSYKIFENEKGGFSMVPHIEVFPSVEALIAARITAGKPMYQLVPGNRDKTGLQLCREPPVEDSVGDAEPDAKLINLRKFKADPEPVLGSTYQQQRLLKGSYEGSAAVFRVLQDSDPRGIKRFLHKASEVSLWRSPYLVPIIGLGVAPQVCLASGFMPLGSLDKYLKDSSEGITTFDLGNAALCLAKAVWYLEENGFVHGKIRCRSAFVDERSAHGAFTVKLGEPGLPVYGDLDVPWIAPEHLSDMDSVANAQKADVYALGTTLWEIFHWGKSPLHVIPKENVREFFGSGSRLSLADVPEEFCPIIAGCWNRNDERSAPDEIVRDINKLLHRLDTPRDRERNLRTNKTAVVPTSSPTRTAKSKATQLPALRHVTQEQSSKLQRRNSAASQSSIASRKTWKTNNLLKYFLRRETEYETLSSISSIAPSQHTVDTVLPDDSKFNDDSFEEVIEEEADEPPQKTDWVLERSNLKMGNVLGQGFFGIVFKAVLTRPSGEKEVVAVKKMKDTDAVADFCHKDLEREIAIMKKLRHPNITEIIGSNEEDGLLLVMEYVGMGALSAYLVANKRKLTTKELVKFSHDVASAMAYLERRRIIHRDLAARNILVKSESCVKLSDFGLAHLLEKEYYTIRTMTRSLPIKWYAPESILYNKFTVKSDVWSYGVALWEIFTFGSEPIVISDDPATLGQWLLEGARLPPPEGCPPEFRQIMCQCWESERNLRPSFASILKRITSIIELME